MSLHVSSAPHVHSKDSTQTIMRDVLIAMLPTTVMGVYCFGFNAALLCVLGVAAAVLAEYGYQKMTRQRVRIGDLSAAVTGLLVALNLPGNAPWWMPVVGSFIAIVLVKQLFGGIGDNFMNPALTARGIMLASWPVRMTAWYLPTFCKGVDAVSSATVLGGYEASTYDMFMGFIPGTIGEVSKIAILIGFIYLLIRKVISWRIPVVFVGTFAVLAAIFRMDQDVLTSVLSGGLLFGAVFMDRGRSVHICLRLRPHTGGHTQVGKLYRGRYLRHTDNERGYSPHRQVRQDKGIWPGKAKKGGKGKCLRAISLSSRAYSLTA